VICRYICVLMSPLLTIYRYKLFIETYAQWLGVFPESSCCLVASQGTISWLLLQLLSPSTTPVGDSVVGGRVLARTCMSGNTWRFPWPRARLGHEADVTVSVAQAEPEDQGPARQTSATPHKKCSPLKDQAIDWRSCVGIPAEHGPSWGVFSCFSPGPAHTYSDSTPIYIKTTSF
jgi:hypothetical protein